MKKAPDICIYYRLIFSVCKTQNSSCCIIADTRKGFKFTKFSRNLSLVLFHQCRCHVFQVSRTKKKP